MAFFANTAYHPGAFGDPNRYVESSLDLATPEQEAARARVARRAKAAEEALATDTPERTRAQANWENDVRETARAWAPLVPSHATATNGVRLTVGADASVLASGPNPQLTTYTVEATDLQRPAIRLRLEALLDPSLPKEGPGRDPVRRTSASLACRSSWHRSATRRNARGRRSPR